MKYLLIIFFLLCVVPNAFSQRIIYSSVEATKSYRPSDIADIHINTLIQKMIIDKKNGTRERIGFDNKMWGYENKESQIFRKYKDRFYLIKNIDGPVFLYFTQSDANLDREKNYLFSTSLNSDVFYLDKKHLLQIFSADKCLVKKIETIKHSYNLNSPGEPELINKFYKECH